MKIISGYWHIKPTEHQAFIELCNWIAPYSKQEAGAISYIFSKDEINENHFLFFEEWRDQYAIDFHIEQWYFKEFMQKTEHMLLSKTVIKIYDISSINEL
jgi:quinol monooxygenase YgiN